MFLHSPMVEVRVPRTNDTVFTVWGPLDEYGNIDDDRLAGEIKEVMELDGDVSVSWMASDILGTIIHNGAYILTLRVV